MEHYGDIHLHHSAYPSGKCPGNCEEPNPHFDHGNMCGTSQQIPGVPYRNGHAYDCGCNLCQAPYSVPYATGPGGFLGDMMQFKPCKNPYCRCADCDGNCKCNVKLMVPITEGFGGGDVNWTFLILLLGVGAAVYYFYFYKKD